MSGGNFSKSGTEVYRISGGCCAKSCPAPNQPKPKTHTKMARLIRVTSQHRAPHHTRIAPARQSRRKFRHDRRREFCFSESSSWAEPMGHGPPSASLERNQASAIVLLV